MVPHHKRKDVIHIFPSREDFIHLPQEMKVGFSELKIASHLKTTHISKSKGASYLTIFMLIFLLIFNQQTWFQAKFCGNKSADLPGKDVIYHF